jgi:type I restriction enzyme, S subunit
VRPERLRRIFRIINGGTPTSEPENWGGEIAWATPVDVGRVHGGRIVKTQRTITTDGLRTGSAAVPPGSLIVSTRAPIGYVAETTARLAFNQGCRGLVPRTQVDIRYFRYQLLAFGARLQALGQGSTFVELSTDDLAGFALFNPALAEQRAIADYLEAEISAMDNLLGKKRRLVELLQERIDSEIMALVGQSAIVHGDRRLRAIPMRRRLAKLDRPAEADAHVVTAFRDGQVTARLLRRSEGFTESWTEGARLQGVLSGDVVVHGLDGFAGAVGTAEADGVCSPVYHVCSPIDGGDAHYYGRLLRLLATTGYLGNFATSTRERAVDFRNWDLFGRVPIPVVETADQRQIGDRIRRLAPIRERVALSERLIKERTHALITAAITGQLKVPGVAA